MPPIEVLLADASSIARGDRRDARILFHRPLTVALKLSSKPLPTSASSRRSINHHIAQGGADTVGEVDAPDLAVRPGGDDDLLGPSMDLHRIASRSGHRAGHPGAEAVAARRLATPVKSDF